jgi:outer membrane protein assembly factor BamB
MKYDSRDLLFIAFCSFLLSGCTDQGGLMGTGLFSKSAPPPLEGKRIFLSQDLPIVCGMNLTKDHYAEACQELSSWPQACYKADHRIVPVKLGHTYKQQWTCSRMFYPPRLGVMPVTMGDSIFLLTSHGSVASINFQGQVIWEVNLVPPANPFSNLGGGLAHDGKHLFVTTSWGELLALGKGGTILWRKTLSSPARNAPVVEDNQVFVLTMKNQVEAYDVSTGRQNWTYSALVEETQLLGTSVPAICGEKLVFAGSSGEVIALSKKNGEELWNASGAPLTLSGEASKFSHIRSLPVIHNGRVYTVSYNGQLSCFSLQSGRSLWTYALSSTETPVVAGNVLFSLSGGHHLMAFHAETGKVFKSYTLPGDQTWKGPIMAGGSLLLTSDQGNVITLDPLSSKIKPLITLDEPCMASPIIVKSHLIFLGQSGNLFFYSPCSVKQLPLLQ